MLFLEDNQEQRESTGEYLTNRFGFAVDFAADIQQADQHVANTKYDVILVDVLLDERAHSGRTKQGDDWLLERQDQLKGSFQAILTAQPTHVRDPGLLKRHGIRIIRKGAEELKFYDSLGHTAPPEPVERISSPEEASAIMLAQQTLSLFYDWVDRLPDAEVKNVWMGGSFRSPSDLKREIAQGTALGERLGALFIAHMRSLLGLDTEEDD